MAKPSAKFDARLKVKKSLFKAVSGDRNFLSAAKFLSKNEKRKNEDLKATEELLKLCRPVSIYLTRIIPEQTTQITNSDFTWSPVPVVRAPVTRAKKQIIIESEPSNHTPAICVPITRCKKEGVQTSERSNETVQKTPRTSNMPTLQHFIDAAYQKELKMFHESQKQLSVGDAVMARMRGYLPWPGRIQSIGSNNKTMSCYFYGTYNSGPVGSKNIMPFDFARETIRLVAIRSPNGYVKGVQEMEIEHGVPDAMSCLSEYNSIN